MTGIVTALLSGALMSIQGVFNTGVTKQTSVWVAAGWVLSLIHIFTALGFFSCQASDRGSRGKSNGFCRKGTACGNAGGCSGR